MSEPQIFQPSPEALSRTLTTAADYDALYRRSVEDPQAFWAEQAKRLDWVTFPKTIKNTTFAYPDVSIRWFEDGVLNVSSNCIDRHLARSRRRGRDHLGARQSPDEARHITYRTSCTIRSAAAPTC
jgi:acetyl-CoA synthetase